MKLILFIQLDTKTQAKFIFLLVWFHSSCPNFPNFVGNLFFYFRAGCVLKTEGILNIVHLQDNLPQGTLPQQAKRGLFSALVLAAAGLPANNRAEYWAQVS